MSKRPLLLDLFCGAGGCSVGYHRAGFAVVGVDHRPQPHYPFSFVCCDALEYLDMMLCGRVEHRIDAIHASPPCQGYSVMRHLTGRSYPDLVGAVRSRLRQLGKPFVIENVEGAPLERGSVLLCGTMFGLRVRRHRVFELWPPRLILAPPCACRNGVVSGRLVGHRVAGRLRAGRRMPPRATEAQRREAIGVPWMTAREARQAIPPAYTEFIGRHLMDHVLTPEDLQK
jgi:DNA (cytosine-5)-methyltransferase 1